MERLSLEGFKEHVAPTLIEKKLIVTDFGVVPYTPEQDRVFVALKGEGDLEAEVNAALVDTGKKLYGEYIKHKGDEPFEPTAESPQICFGDDKGGKFGRYELVQAFSDPDVASQAYIAYVLKYVNDATNKLVTQTANTLKDAAQNATTLLESVKETKKSFK